MTKKQIVIRILIFIFFTLLGLGNCAPTIQEKEE